MSLNVRKTEAAEKTELAPWILEICLERLSGWLKHAGGRRWIVRTGSQFLTHQLSNSDSPKASAGCTCHFSDMHQTWKTQSRPGLSLHLPLPRNTHSSPTLPTQAVILSYRKEDGHALLRGPCMSLLRDRRLERRGEVLFPRECITRHSLSA